AYARCGLPRATAARVPQRGQQARLHLPGHAAPDRLTPPPRHRREGAGSTPAQGTHHHPPTDRKEPVMGRKETVSYHHQEAAAARLLAAQADGPGRGDLLEQAQDHDAMAEAARVGDYPTDLPRCPAARG